MLKNHVPFGFGALPKNWPCAPDDGNGEAGGSGSSDDTKDKAPEKPVFDEAQQAFINGLLKKEKTKAEEKLKKSEEKFSALEKQLANLQTRLDDKDKPDDKTEDGKIEVLQKRHQRELDELKARLDAADQRAVAAEKQRVEAERDRLLHEALVAAGCIDLKAGVRIFLPDVTRQDEDGDPTDSWLLKTPSGKLVDIATGVSEHLPKYLRGPSVNVGGAGTLSGSPKAKDRDKVKALEDEVNRLKDTYTKSNNPNHPALMQYRAKVKELNALKAQVSGKTP